MRQTIERASGRRALAALTLGALACGGEGPAGTALRVPGLARDLDPNPRVVHVELVATRGSHVYLTGRPAEIWGYADGPDAVPTVPGPVIEARVGDVIVVGLTNRLDMPTTVHWHGLRLPAAADGSTSTQEPVLPGMRYEARFTALDAGTFWYHPHIRADEQVERGLYGALIVREAAPPTVDADRLFLLDDVKLTADGRLAEGADPIDLRLGRRGNVVVVNGQRRPRIGVAPRARERWRFVNAANGRYFRLRLPGHALRVIGGDAGLLHAPYDAETVLIAPGERYEVLVEPVGATGETVTLFTEPHDRGLGTAGDAPIALLDVVGEGAALPTRAPLDVRGAPFAGVALDAATPVRAIVLRERENAGELRFLINDQAWPFNQPVRVQQGTTEIWEVDNLAETDHPFHVHGMFFDVLSIGGVPPAHRGWKDTVNVPARNRVRFAIRYDPVGMWMFHCTIPEHATRGMMGDLEITP
ncbi:MAG: multicopper oxidase family protein [Deltaproteobacteria bacterium]|nr:multicopper oxidase family protein [Deltaproteobacteria bacterium]